MRKPVIVEYNKYIQVWTRVKSSCPTTAFALNSEIVVYGFDIMCLLMCK